MAFQIVLVAVGGFFGAIFRYLFSNWLNKPKFYLPFGTLIVNLLGSLFLGWVVGSPLFKMWLLLFGTGFMGALTTFSTLSWEIIRYQNNKNLGKSCFCI